MRDTIDVSEHQILIIFWDDEGYIIRNKDIERDDDINAALDHFMVLIGE